MKHARKMVLVDVNSINRGTIKTNINNNETVTDAIKTLANASEFNRSYFGQSTISISQLNNELQDILERTDLEPENKLKLYNRGLARYLFLQRESTKPIQAQGSVIIQTPISTSHSPAKSNAPSSFTASPSVSDDESVKTLVSGKSLHSKNTSRNSHIKEVIQTRIPKFKSNLPRSTPKEEILRQQRTNKRRSDFFYGWENNQ